MARDLKKVETWAPEALIAIGGVGAIAHGIAASQQSSSGARPGWTNAPVIKQFFAIEAATPILYASVWLLLIGGAWLAIREVNAHGR